MIHTSIAHCRWCAHYLQGRKCRAFPEQIPDVLWSGENPHREAFEDDQGYRYTPAVLEIPPIEDAP